MGSYLNVCELDKLADGDMRTVNHPTATSLTVLVTARTTRGTPHFRASHVTRVRRLRRATKMSEFTLKRS